MPTAAVEVDTDVYASAGEQFLAANHDICDLVAAAADGAQWAAGMAGSDSTGASWASQYDTAAGAVLQAGASAADAVGWVGELLLGSGDNHARAEAASTAGGPPHYPGDSGVAGAESVLPATPPTADGSPSDPPTGWCLVAHLLAWTWPSGHQDQLRAVAQCWSRASVGLGAVADRLSAPIGEISALRSPEIDAAVARCTDVQLSVRRLAEAAATLAAMCTLYAERLDAAHSAVLRQLATLVAECAAIEAAGALLSEPTAGAGQIVAQNAVEARATVAAAEIAVELGRLAAIVDALTNVLREVVLGATAILVSLHTFVAGSVSADLAKVVVRAEKATLAARLATAPTWRDGNFPDGGPPNGIRVRRGPQGTVTHYAVYDADGLIVRRIDLVGMAHNGIPTPHTVYYQHDRNPRTGATHVKVMTWTTRPVRPEEVP